MSLKHTVRKTIAGVMIAEVATSYFAGCSKTEPTDEDFYTSDISLAETVDSLTPGIEDSEIDLTIDTSALFKDANVDMRYKFWYDNPDVEEAQKADYEEARSGTPTTSLHLGLFPTYEDSSGSKYFISGRTKTSTANSGILPSLRDEETGKLHYLHLAGVTDASFLAAFYEVLAEEDINQPTEFNDYADNTDLASFDPDVTYKVFVNNLDTKANYNRSQVTMPITKWLKDFNLAALEVEDTAATLTLNTGAGLVELRFDKYEDPGSEWDKAWKITYTDDTVQVVKNSEIVLNGDVMSFSPEAIQKVLGYSIIVYDSAINIVTDNKDLANEESVIPSQIPEAAPAIDSDAPWNQDAEATNNEETAEPEPEPEVDMSRMPAPAIDAVDEWTETPASGTFYVNDDGVSSREKPIQGSTRVKNFNTNDTVTITAITNTGYYKLSDGSFLHQDFTSSTKIESVMAPIPDFQDPAPATNTGSGSSNSSGGNSNSGNSGNSGNSSSSSSGTINSEGYYVDETGYKIPTSKVGMELDANGLPVDTAKYRQFIDDDGQGWDYGPFGWEKASFTGHAQGSHTNVDTSKLGEEIVGY